MWYCHLHLKHTVCLLDFRNKSDMLLSYSLARYNDKMCLLLYMNMYNSLLTPYDLQPQYIQSNMNDQCINRDHSPHCELIEKSIALKVKYV